MEHDLSQSTINAVFQACHNSVQIANPDREAIAFRATPLNEFSELRSEDFEDSPLECTLPHHTIDLGKLNLRERDLEILNVLAHAKSGLTAREIAQKMPSCPNYDNSSIGKLADWGLVQKPEKRGLGSNGYSITGAGLLWLKKFQN